MKGGTEHQGITGRWKQRALGQVWWTRTGVGRRARWSNERREARVGVKGRKRGKDRDWVARGEMTGKKGNKPAVR